MEDERGHKRILNILFNKKKKGSAYKLTKCVETQAIWRSLTGQEIPWEGNMVFLTISGRELSKVTITKLSIFNK